MTFAVEDLSLGGMRARGDAAQLAARPGEMVNVRVEGMGPDAFEFTADAQVVRVEEGVLAIEWSAADPVVAEHIMMVLATRPSTKGPR